MNLTVNHTEPLTMHIDLNSCFATIEQQANPLLRDRPLVVAAYKTDRACVLAPSIEAKRFGIKTGMCVIDAKTLCSGVIVLTPDPGKYRFVYQKFCKLFSQYTPNMHPKSIDEAVLRFQGTPITKHKTLIEIGYDIKRRMREEIGDWLKCNVGIATNGFLAKTAASLHKPDGLDVITEDNLRDVYKTLDLEDLYGIAHYNKIRLATAGIFRPLEFFDASLQTLRSAFQSVNAYYWYLRLRGWEIDDVVFQRRTIGHSYHLPKFTADLTELNQLVCKLTEKMGRRLRDKKLTARGMHVSCLYSDGTYWNHGHKNHDYSFYTSKELYVAAKQILAMQPEPKPVRILAVNCFALTPMQPTQISLFPEIEQGRALTKALDQVNDRFGEFTVTPATMLGMKDIILDRIAFGNTRDIVKQF